MTGPGWDVAYRYSFMAEFPLGGLPTLSLIRVIQWRDKSSDLEDLIISIALLPSFSLSPPAGQR